jgi:hypothetical protein
VNHAVRRGCARVGLRGISELAGFFAPDGLRARIAGLTARLEQSDRPVKRAM